MTVKSKSLPNEDPLKSCIRERLSEGGRSEEEATAWCKDFLAMKADYDDSTSADSANIKEAERIFIHTREDIVKPRELEQCIRNRQTLFGEGEWTAGRNCHRDWELGERVRGSAMVATDGNEPIDIIHRELDAPEPFKQLERLRIALDHRTTALMEKSHVVHGSRIYHYTPEEAERKARKELGLPQVYHPKQPDVATVPDVFGKSREQRIKESYGADTERRRPGEKPTTVPNLYGKSHDQIVREALEQHDED